VILVLQRVARAAVRVGAETVAEIGTGLCVLACALDGDGPQDIAWLVRKLATLRLFEDAAGRTNLSLAQVGGAVLLVPQFTLAADLRQGRRPSFDRAAAPGAARALLAALSTALVAAGLPVAEGRFGADMSVDLENQGPFTLILDSRDRPGSAGRTSP
jgi:D-tyrosyl-tRNA(Tyr) deacylase